MSENDASSRAKQCVAFDHHTEAFASVPWRIVADLHSRDRVTWTDAHGGFWIISRYADVVRALRDWRTFSSRHDEPYSESVFGGQAIPQLSFQLSMAEMDPPDSLLYRQLLQPIFTPRRVQELKPHIRQITIDCLNQCLETGRIEFITSLVNPVPSMVVLELLGLPVEDWPRHALPWHHVSHAVPGSADYDVAMREFDDMWRLVTSYVDERRDNPNGDLLSRIVNGMVSDKVIERKQAIDLAWVTIAAALETTTGIMAHSLDYLDRDRELRERLIRDRSLVRVASQELLRFFSPSRGVARTVTVDCEFAGQQLRPGDRVFILLAGANHDEAAFRQANTLTIDRSWTKSHVTFGHGIHRCIGSAIAEAELEILLDVVLDVIPDFTIERDRAEPYRVQAVSTGFVKLPAVFHPRAPIEMTDSSP
jgi:cytochrome P450